jgi:hypothetical protein
MLAINEEMLDILRHLDPVRIIDRERGTVEIEVPIPEIGLAPALRKVLQIAASNDVAVPLAGRNPAPSPRLAGDRRESG